MRRSFIFVFATILFQAVFGQKEKLGFNLIVGQTYYLIMKSSTGIGPDLKGQRTIFHLTSESRLAFKVTDLKDSIYDISVSFQQLEMSTKLPFGGDISFFNSDKKDKKDTFSNVLNAIIDKPFLVKMTILGKIVVVKGIDSNFKAALDKFPELSRAQKLQFKAQFMQAFGENTFKCNLEMATAIYSNDSVKKGDNWTIKESGRGETIITTYEFLDKVGNYNLITGNGNIETLNADGYTQINGIPAKYNLTDTINSSLQVDNKTGWIIEEKIYEFTTESGEIKDNPKLSGGKKMTMSVSKEMTYSSK